jgi:hypothetical protein
MHARQGQAFPGVTPSFHLLNYQLSKQRIPVVCPLTFYRQRTSRTLPKWIAALALAARVGNQTVYQFQDVLFAMDIRQRIIVHALGKVDRVHHLDAVAEMPQHSAALDDQTAFRVGHNERAGVFLRHALHEIWFDEESRLAAARTADHQHVFVPRRSRVFGAAVHRQPLGLRQQDVVFENGVDKRLDVLARSP